MPHPLFLRSSNSSDGTLDVISGALLTTATTFPSPARAVQQTRQRRQQVSGSDLERAETLPAGLGDAKRDRQRSGQVEAPELMAQGASVSI